VPVPVLNDAHEGRFCTLKVNGSLSASFAVGLKMYELPSFIAGVGEPDMVGRVSVAVPEAAFTVIEKGANAAHERPSVTAILMLLYVPTPVGVPLRRPLETSNVAQAGLFLIQKRSEPGGVTVGVKE